MFMSAFEDNRIEALIIVPLFWPKQMLIPEVIFVMKQKTLLQIFHNLHADVSHFLSFTRKGTTSLFHVKQRKYKTSTRRLVIPFFGWINGFHCTWKAKM